MTTKKPSRHRAIRLRVAFYLFFGNLIALFLALNLWEYAYDTGLSYPAAVYALLDVYFDYLVYCIAPFVWLSGNLLNYVPESLAGITFVFTVNAAGWATIVHFLLWLMLRKRLPSWRTYRIPKE